MADLLVVEEEIPLGEEDFPVVIAGADKRESECAGIRHVGADVEKVFKEPECAEGHPGGFAAEKEIRGADERDNEFGECAAENHESLAERAEEWVAGFVDHEIGVIEEEKVAATERSVEKKE